MISGCAPAALLRSTLWRTLSSMRVDDISNGELRDERFGESSARSSCGMDDGDR